MSFPSAVPHVLFSNSSPISIDEHDFTKVIISQVLPNILQNNLTALAERYGGRRELGGDVFAVDLTSRYVRLLHLAALPRHPRSVCQVQVALVSFFLEIDQVSVYSAASRRSLVAHDGCHVTCFARRFFSVGAEGFKWFEVALSGGQGAARGAIAWADVRGAARVGDWKG